MADDLKPMLTKVLASGGEKKFFFAYGVGKRKDGKGEGELAVRGKKPKKPEIEGVLAACKEFHEGVCWVGKGPNDSETVYFLGKGKALSAMLVTKMILTAKSAVGRHYDFQLPSPEEEQRAAAFVEGDGEEVPTAPPPTDVPPSSKPPTALPNLEAAYLARVKALTEGLKTAITSGTPAGNEAKLRFGESQLFARKQDYQQAMALLDVVEEQIQKALAGPGGDPAAEWKAKLAEWSPAIKTAILAKAPKAAEITTLLTQATALSKPGGDMAQALAKLSECHALATGGAPTDGTHPVDTLAAEWKAKLAEWSPAIKTAMAAKRPNAAAIAKLLTQAMALAKPDGDIAQALAQLAECHALATGGAGQPGTDLKALSDRWKAEQMKVLVNLKETIKIVIATQDPDAGLAELELKAVMKQLSGTMETQKRAVEMERYLENDEVVDDVCELAFDVKKPLLRVLAEIKPHLPA